MNSENDPDSYAVIGHAMAVHRELGPGLDEIFYHELLAHRLKAAGIAHEFKLRRQLIHRGLVADEFEADLILARRLVVELKVLFGDFAPEHLLQIICYLKFWRLPAGLLLDFGKESLIQRRVVFTEPKVSLDVSALLADAPAFVTDKPLLGALAEATAKILSEHGLGYRDTTYRGLMFAELMAERVPVARDPVVGIRNAGRMLGEAALPCLVLDGRCAVMVVALRETRQAADRAVLQTCLKHLGMPWGLLLNFGKRGMNHLFVSRPR
jgi:GxxExxY protein